MKKLRRLLFRLTLIILVIIIGILAVNTVRFSSRQLSVEAVELPSVSDAVANRLATALRIPTISYPDRVDSLAFRQLDTFIQTNYPLVDSFLNYTAIHQFSRLYEWKGRNPNLAPILLLGHLDVVPVESDSSWQTAPFAGKIEDGYIWGRGALDDKNSVFGLLEAAELLLSESYVPERSLYLAFGHDEEVSGKNGAIQIADYLQQKGLTFEYILDEGQLVLEEALPGLDVPLAMIGIAEKGYTTLEITAQLPEGGHSSMPPQETAIQVLSAALLRLQEQPFPAKVDGATAGLFRHVGPEMNLPFKTIFANLWLFEGMLTNQLSNDPAANAIIRTTMAPTIIRGGVRENVLPTEALAIINFRILPGETISSVQQYVEEVIADERITVTLANEDFAQNPSPVSAANTFGFEILHRTIQEVFPEVVIAPALVIGATDSRHYKSVSEHIYRFMPVQLTKADLKRIHGIDERISIERYKHQIQFYRQLILNSCQ